jgi:hypothetical protein
MMRGTEFSTGKFYTRSKKLHGTAAIRLIVIAATWDRGELTASAVDAWARRQPDFNISGTHQLARYDVRQYSMTPPPVTAPQPADPLWRRALRYVRLTRSGRQ